MFGIAGFLGLLMIGSSVDISGLFGEGAEDTSDDSGSSDGGQLDGNQILADDATGGGDFLDMVGPLEGENETPVTSDGGVPYGTVSNGAQDGSNVSAGPGTAAGGSGNDGTLLFGGAGEDNLNGDMGDDTLAGVGGEDELSGHSGGDFIRGDAGDDWLIGGQGNDSLDGGEGADRLMGGGDDDIVVGGPGLDVVNGSDGDDRLYGVSNADHAADIVDDSAQDFLNGSDGDDHLMIGAGDNAHGGPGADSFVMGDWFDAGGPAVIEDFDAAEDELVVVYDDNAHSAPALGLEADPDDPDTTVLTLDGVAVAELHDPAGLDLNQVTLVPASGIALPMAAAA